MSDIEYRYHLLAEYADPIIDIREQYALLPREETQQIAADLGIRHPSYLDTGVARVMTSDLVLTMAAGTDPPYIVICCKAASDLDPAKAKTKRTLEKLLIERTYWGYRDVRWVLGTDEMLPTTKVYNLDLFRSCMFSRELDWLNPLFGNFRDTLFANYKPDIPLNKLLEEIASRLGIRQSDAFTLLGRGIWSRQVPVDLDSRRISHEMPLPLFSTFQSGT